MTKKEIDMIEEDNWIIGEQVWIEYEKKQAIGTIVSTDFGGYFLLKLTNSKDDIIIAEERELHKICEKYQKNTETEKEKENPLYMAIAELIQIGEKSKSKKRTNILKNMILSIDSNFAKFFESFTENTI